MSSGGPFKLIINDSSVDDLMMRSKNLLDLIRKIETARKQKKEEEKAKAKAEAQALGKKYVEIHDEDDHDSYVPTIAEISNRFTVPIFSFFKPFVACSMEYVKHQPKGRASFGSTIAFPLNQLGLCITDAVLHLRTSSFGTDGTGTNGVRWCSYPAHRALAHTTLKVNGILIDEYFSEDYNAHFAFNIPNKKKNVWMKNVGQQVPIEGVIYPDPVDAEVGEIRHFVDGNQTVKETQPAQDWWVPLLFWFCDPGYCLPNGLFRNGSSEISIDLANASELVSLITVTAPVASFSYPTIQLLELWVNQVYVVPELHDIFLARYGHSLIRVHRHQKKEIRSGEEGIKLDGLRWPVERFYFAFQPTENLDNDQQWHKVSVLTEFKVNTAISTNVFSPAVPAAGFNISTYYAETPTVTNLSLEANGNSLFPKIDSAFFNSAIAFQHGNSDISGPDDIGWYCMNFNIKPLGGIHTGGHNPPSGYVNCSKARELYLHFTSTYINSAHPVNLIVSGIALNFLAIDDSSAQLKYST